MHRSGRTPLFQQLRRTFHAARLENRGQAAPLRSGISRRQILAGAAAGVLAAYTRPVLAAPAGPRVAVVGAGIAGLVATHLLAKAGFNVTLYEGSSGIGGRIQTNYGGVAKDVYTELGGEFIDSGHEDMLGLAKFFGFELIDTQGHSDIGTNVAYFAKGKIRNEADVIAAFKPLAEIIDNDSAQLSDEITFDSHSAYDARLDNTNLRQYLQSRTKNTWLYEILLAAYVNEFGLELENQSSLNFVETIGTDTSDGFQIYGESDQRYKIRGGNHRITGALAESVANRIELGHVLSAISLNSSGVYELSFDLSSTTGRTVDADIVVLCLPFTILRDVDIRVPLPAIKTKAIQELGYGTNAKLIMGFQDRYWRDSKFGGDSYADLPYQSGWDGSRDQQTIEGAYTIYPGGTKASNLGTGSALDQANRLLPGLNSVFPGVQKRWLGTALRAYWPSNPFIRASYASYLPGQWTGIRGAEGMSVGNLHFAGEHTSLDWQGYMNGGAESGRLVAETIIGNEG